MKKKILAIVLVAAMACTTLMACGSAEEPKEEAAAEETVEETAAEPAEDAAADDAAGDLAGKVIGYVPKTLSNEYFVGMKDELVATAESYGMTVEISAPDTEQSVDQQIAFVENYIAMGVDGIVLVPCTGSQVVDVINKADEAGIPVIVCDTPAEESNYISTIATNNYEGGKLAADWMGSVVKGKVVILDSDSGNTATTARKNGFYDQIKNYPDVEVVNEAYANADRGVAMTQTENFLTADPDLAGIFACADMMALGAAEAVAAAGKQDQVTICGFDGQPDAAQAVLDGTIQATIAQKPATMGRMAIENLIKYWNGEEVEKEIDTGCEVVLPENAEQYLNWN